MGIAIYSIGLVLATSLGSRVTMSWLKKLGIGRGNVKDESEGRRDRERAEVKLPFALEVGDNKYVGYTSDVSLEGALLQVEEGTILSPEIEGWNGKLRLMLPRGEVHCDCKVSQVKWSAIAIKFLGMKKGEESEKLLDYLETQLGEVW